MLRTPWYQILSNSKYVELFQYTGSYVTEREKLIEDGYMDHEESYLFEQSDMVVVLLNLSYIPDEVVKTIRFDEFGWSVKFKKQMDLYK